MIPPLLSVWWNGWSLWSVLTCFFDHFNCYVMATDTLAYMLKHLCKKLGVKHGVFVGGSGCSPLHFFPQSATMALITNTCMHTHTHSHTLETCNYEQHPAKPSTEDKTDSHKCRRMGRRRRNKPRQQRGGKKEHLIIQQSGKTRHDRAYRLLSFISAHPVVSPRASAV